MTIHDPDVVLTDLGLVALGGFLAWRLSRLGPGGSTRAGVMIMTALSSAALFGAVYHALFTSTATRAGFITWIPVPLSILVVSSTLLSLGLQTALPRLQERARIVIVSVYAAAFGLVVLFVDESYATIVRFYAPVLILFLIVAAWQWLRHRAGGWSMLTAALLVSIAAAVLQQRRVAIHPVYFDHNALYHVLQGIGLVLLYIGFTREAGSTPSFEDLGSRRRDST
jgi:Family of unknown function (DUF6962)